jgi:hypothetical protein
MRVVERHLLGLILSPSKDEAAAGVGATENQAQRGSAAHRNG